MVATDVTDDVIRNTSEYDVTFCASVGLQADDDDDTGEFYWSKELQGVILSSIFWGLMFTQIPGGFLSEKYGPRRVILCAMTSLSVLGLLSPLAARSSPYLLIVVRICIGLAQGAVPPAIQALYSRWFPLTERSRLVAISWSGNVIGSGLTFPFVSFLCKTLGWDYVFYVTSGVGLLWCMVWLALVSDSPSTNRWITPLERRYIETNTSFRPGRKQPRTPWRAMLTSRPFWCILVAHVSGNYGLYMMMTQIPTYMKEVLNFDLQSNGLFSMLPFMCMWVCMNVSGQTADFLITRQILSRVNTRKLMGCLGLFLPAVCVVAMSYMDCRDQMTAVLLLCSAVGLSGSVYAGFMINHGEVAPQFAGTMFGLSNTVATIPGMLAPYIVSAVTPNKTREEWQVAFFIMAAVHVVGGVTYLLFATTAVEPWAVDSGRSECDVSGGKVKLEICADSGVDEKNGEKWRVDVKS